MDFAAVSVCLVCNGLGFWHWKKLVYPMGTHVEPIEGMPEKAADLFKEAQSIANASPRAALILLRVCLEEIADAKGATGRTLHERVLSLRLPPRLEKLYMICKALGNGAAHKYGIDLDSDHDTALKAVFDCSEFINRLVDELFNLDAKLDQYEQAAKKKP